jgi:hypothetical protein
MSYKIPTEDDLNAFRKKLKDALGEDYEVEIKKEVSDQFGIVKKTYDLVVFYRENAVCGIEYKSSLEIPSYKYLFKFGHIEKLNHIGLKYSLVYFGQDNEVLFWSKDSVGYKSFTFEDVITAIKGNQTCGKRFTPSEIVTKFFGVEEIKDCRIQQVDGLKSLFNENTLVYDEEKATMWLKTEAEDEFFKILLGQEDNKNEIKHVCRYTSLKSLFYIMKESNQVMCSITCMNDKGETSYADKYVGYGAFARSSSTIKEDNDCFILSCCKESKKDDLTMWRLYGNDGGGVCLGYKVNMSIIDNKEFFFAPVSYGIEKNNHPELNFIRLIKHWEERGWSFVFKRWYIWKHFFKSYLFKDEKEVRLLYIWTKENEEKPEWIMDSTNNIVSRICKFPFNNNRFPLTLDKAIIGPKCPEQESNVAQFNYMNEQLNLMQYSWIKPAVIPSEIMDYR